MNTSKFNENSTPEILFKPNGRAYLKKPIFRTIGFKLLVLFILLFGLFSLLYSYYKPFSQKNDVISPKIAAKQAENPTWWQVQSIDTMKYSRDRAREYLGNVDDQDFIDEQVKNIALTGATHVAIATPYDEEFLPVLEKWVLTARKHGLNVWFRGNWSGWEGWFEYPAITREQHIAKTEDFILNNKHLFKHGDLFSSCPECENGGPGDPRNTGDIKGHRKFLIDEYKVTKEAFRKINVNVQSNLFSMNADVARATMNEETVKELDGLIVIDHYVKSPQKLAEDVKRFNLETGAKVMLGEIGAPIPDIHGDMTETEQASWINDALYELSNLSDIVYGVSYWTNVGGSTQLWNTRGEPNLVVNTLSMYFAPKVFSGVILDDFDDPVSNASLTLNNRTYYTSIDGTFNLPYIDIIDDENFVSITSSSHEHKKVSLSHAGPVTIRVAPNDPSFIYRIRLYLRELF